VLQQLRAYESRNVTYVAPDGSWPIVWARARGTRVWDAEGKPYLDLTAAFGVANSGHANPRVVRAGQRQMGTLLHAMGDVHPHPGKAALARALSEITFERWGDPGRATGQVIFGNSGFEAVEAALKTARLGTGKPGVIAFEGAYHGLGYGALNATHREMFREPFRDQLREFGHFVPFPETATQLRQVEAILKRLVRQHRVGAVVTEPIQGRGGMRVPAEGFLPTLRRVCDRHGLLLILDEVYTGFGRTGRWFACEHSGTVPDLICLGKALTGGFPLSACVGHHDLMEAAWPASCGEAIHTSTFLGHPVGCAMALAQLKELKTRRLPERAARAGTLLTELLRGLRVPDGLRTCVRGQGLMVGLELCHADGRPATEPSLELVKRLLHQGFILLPDGPHANVIAFTPPLTISEAELRRTVQALQRLLLTPSEP
jgi:4-aminobutyrate aminotransferase-like enzyme